MDVSGIFTELATRNVGGGTLVRLTVFREVDTVLPKGASKGVLSNGVSKGVELMSTLEQLLPKGAFKGVETEISMRRQMWITLVDGNALE